MQEEGDSRLKSVQHCVAGSLSLFADDVSRILGTTYQLVVEESDLIEVSAKCFFLAASKEGSCGLLLGDHGLPGRGECLLKVDLVGAAILVR